jgi:hypothetical protein
MSARARVAYDPEWAEYSSDGHKLLSDNRAAYIAQSAATRDGNVAPWERLQADFEREFGEAYAREECANGRANEYDDRGFLVE